MHIRLRVVKNDASGLARFIIKPKLTCTKLILQHNYDSNLSTRSDIYITTWAIFAYIWAKSLTFDPKILYNFISSPKYKYIYCRYQVWWLFVNWFLRYCNNKLIWHNESCDLDLMTQKSDGYNGFSGYIPVLNLIFPNTFPNYKIITCALQPLTSWPQNLIS